MPRRNQKQHRNGGMSFYCSQCFFSKISSFIKLKSMKINLQLNIYSQLSGHPRKFNCDGRRTGEGVMAANVYPDLIRHTMKDFDIQNQLK